MGVSIKATASQGQNVYRKTMLGELELVEVNRAEYVAPHSGNYQLRLVGVSEPFELEGVYGRQQKVRLEWLVIAGKKEFKGTVFSDMYTLALSPKSNLGKVYMALTGEGIEEGADVELTDLIGREMTAAVRQETKAGVDGTPRVYANVVVDSAMPVEADGDGEDVVPVKGNGTGKNPFTDN